MVGVLGVELEQAVRQQEEHDVLPDRAQGEGVDQARQARAELGGDFRDRMEHPVAVPELLESLGDDRPELARRGFRKRGLCRSPARGWR